jgi:hypothetical protein
LQGVSSATSSSAWTLAPTRRLWFSSHKSHGVNLFLKQSAIVTRFLFLLVILDTNNYQLKKITRTTLLVFINADCSGSLRTHFLHCLYFPSNAAAYTAGTPSLSIPTVETILKRIRYFRNMRAKQPITLKSITITPKSITMRWE